MTVARDRHDSRKRVALLNHDLVADSSSSGVEVDPVGARERLDARVLGEVGGRAVLDVVVEREDRLTGVGDLGGANRLEPVASSSAWRSS